MDLSYLGITRAVASLLRWLAHGATPPATLTALAFGVLAMLAGFGTRLFDARIHPTPRSLLNVLALWAMACASTIMWLKCLLALHGHGLA